MKKILISAYACSPGEGSEPGIGWNQVLQSARTHEIWAITRSNNRPAIEKYLAERPLSHVHWIYYDLPRWASRWKKGMRGMRLYYLLWQCGAYYQVRHLHRRVRFDVVHHVTFVNYWLPTMMAFLSIPLVWGPIGGGESGPRELRQGLEFRKRLLEVTRDIARAVGEANPLVRFTARRAAIGLATSPETEKRLRSLGSKNTRVLPAVALPIDELDQLSRLPMIEEGAFRVLSVGRLLYWKGFDIGLRAFSQMLQKHPDSQYWIIGDGPERRRLEALVQSIGIRANVRFLGTVSREQVLTIWGASHTLLFPSLHDSGGWASLEAMAAGRPVICLDVGGPALQVTSQTGFRISPGSPQHVINDIACALVSLASDRKQLRRMGDAGRRRVQEYFNWDLKGIEIAKIYDRLCVHGAIETASESSPLKRMRSSPLDRI